MNIKSSIQSVAILFLSTGMALATTIGFDDLSATPSGNNHDSVANGYGGLNWNNFEVLDGADSANTGYKPGTVSGKNVAFNAGGAAAVITAPAFNLTSGYFASAWNDNLRLEVQGYVGNTLTYDNIYTLSATSTTLLDFNYLGVDQVDFISTGGTTHSGYGGTGTQFVLDDLTINGSNSTVPDAGSTGLMLGASLAGLGVIRKKLKLA